MDTTHAATGPVATSGGRFLIPGENILSTVKCENGDVSLTDRRVVLEGRAGDQVMLQSVSLSAITSVRIERRSRESRSAWWGGAGLVAAIGVWQVSSNGTVGMIAGGIVALLALALLGDYWLRPSGVQIAFLSPGDSLRVQIADSQVDDAAGLLDRYETARDTLAGPMGPTATYSPF